MRLGTACISCHCHKNMALSGGTAFPVSRGCQPRNRAVRDVVAAGDLAHRLAVDVAPADRLALLVFGQFRFAAELDAACLGALPPFTSVFGEPDDFQAALSEEGVVRFLVTGRGQFRARLTQIVLHRLSLSAGEEELSRIAFVAVPAGMVLILLPIGERPPPIWGGIGMRMGEIITLGSGQRVHGRTDGPSRWGTIRLPAQDMARYGRALNGAGFDLPQFVARWQPPPAARRDLSQLPTGQARLALRPSKTSIKRMVEKVHALTDRARNTVHLLQPMKTKVAARAHPEVLLATAAKHPVRDAEHHADFGDARKRLHL
jgi:hypothetical protein